MKRIPELILSAMLLAMPSGVAFGAQAGSGPAQTAVYREGRDAIDSQDWAQAERNFREYLASASGRSAAMRRSSISLLRSRSRFGLPKRGNAWPGSGRSIHPPDGPRTQQRWKRR